MIYKINKAKISFTLDVLQQIKSRMQLNFQAHFPLGITVTQPYSVMSGVLKCKEMPNRQTQWPRQSKPAQVKDSMADQQRVKKRRLHRLLC